MAFWKFVGRDKMKSNAEGFTIGKKLIENAGKKTLHSVREMRSNLLKFQREYFFKKKSPQLKFELVAEKIVEKEKTKHQFLSKLVKSKQMKKNHIKKRK